VPGTHSGWWVRDGVLDHEGSVGGYQSLLMLVPERELVLAVLTNSWKGSALIRELVGALGLTPPAPPSPGRRPAVGRYALESMEAVVTRTSVTESEPDPVTGAKVDRRYPLSLDAPLMSWRTDFPRPGVARIGWVALPHAGS
jgi:Beta-lactamase.